MTITATDIKLLESERMTDTTDGGGRRTNRIIADGVAGNIFPKVSRLDSVYGRVNLRKIFGAVQTATAETYAGAHAIITDAPDNANIHTTLFSTGSEFDQRTAARDRIESYVTSGPESRMTLLGKQLAGQMSIVAYQRIEEALPELGEVYCLSTESSNTVTAYQYFRIQSISSEIRTFTELVGSAYVEFKRRVITMDTGVPLRYDFTGTETAVQNSGAAKSTKLRTTTVVDAARYFGIRPLQLAAAQNDLSIKVDTVYSPIVPTTNRETPLSNVAMGGAAAVVSAKAAPQIENITGSSAWANNTTYYTRRPITPGTLTISGSGFTTGADDKKGNISHTSFVGTIDYENGRITRTGGSYSSNQISANYTPGGLAPQTAHTLDIQISTSNRGAVWALTLNPIPSPGTTFVDYRALGKWYRLRDNGAGELLGDDAAYGVGSIDYTTGAVVITLGALPDVDTSIIVGYGSKLHFNVRADATADVSTKITQRITLLDLPVAADSVSISYYAGGVQYTATDNASGVITGTGVSGTINYGSGIIDLEFTSKLPDSNAGVAVNYQQEVASVNGEQRVRSQSAAYTSSITLGTAVVPGTFNGSLPLSGTNVFIQDNGLGVVIAKGGQTIGGAYFSATGMQVIPANATGSRNARITGDQVIGTINYATGAVTITAGVTVDYEYYQPPTYTFTAMGAPNTTTGASWTASQKAVAFGNGTMNLGWKDSGVTVTSTAKSYNASFTSAPIKVDLTATIAEKLVPGSIMFTAGGKTYIDRNGSLYYDVNQLTGAGTLGGTIDYETGEVSLSSWADGATLSLAVNSALTTHGDNTEFQLFFRTNGSPLRPASLYIQVLTEGGTTLSATSDENGLITGTKVTGTVDSETGIVRVKFGQMVSAAGNTGEWWYNAANVVGGMIFKPELVIPSTLRYNAVVLANLPLNADILGLDPVRLPSDGRVPIYRSADVVVIHNTQSMVLTDNPALAGATYSVGRSNLAEIWVVDQNGLKLSSDQYISSLINGTVTISASPNFTGYVQPFIIKHRVEDLAMLTDVQINGRLTLAAPLTRSYAAGTTFVSSAVLFGDMNARVTNLHDLGSFSNWTDTVGTGATAQFNDIDFPVEVKNNGALTERWRINFTSSTAFQVVGENLGVIATGNTSSDCSPTNALTGNPYFIIRASGWGSGWAAGNQLRFNTVGAAAPIWVARTILPGATLNGDSFSLQMRGDVDAV